jgi:hypothetical protein
MFESNSGRVQFAITEEYLSRGWGMLHVFHLKIYDDKYIDNWYHLKSEIYRIDGESPRIDFENNELKINDTVTTYEGHMFEDGNDHYCLTYITLSWEYNNYGWITGFSGKVDNERCDGVQLNFTIDRLVKEETGDALYYSLFVTTLILFQIFSTILLNIRINNSTTNPNSVFI